MGAVLPVHPGSVSAEGRLALLAAVLLATQVTLGASPASAVLFAVDRVVAGDGEITRDTDTGLDWLDLTLTTNVSLDDIQADVGGWISDGWMHATRAEACQLFANAGNTSFASTCPFQELASAFVSEAESLVALLGDTGGEGPFFQGYLERPDPTKASTDFGRVGVAKSPGPTVWEVIAVGSTGADPSTGNFLVRAIPEPSSAALLPAGLALLAARRLRAAPGSPGTRRRDLERTALSRSSSPTRRS